MPFDKPGWGPPDPNVDKLPDDGNPKPEIDQPVDEDEIRRDDIIKKPRRPQAPRRSPYEQPPTYMSGWVIS